MILHQSIRLHELCFHMSGSAGCVIFCDVVLCVCGQCTVSALAAEGRPFQGILYTGECIQLFSLVVICDVSFVYITSISCICINNMCQSFDDWACQVSC